jgi:alkylated DNA repair protein (DNA oxidative demethylase)
MSLPEGFRYLPERFDRAAQAALLSEILSAVEAAGTPFYRPTMPKSGAPLSVEMTNLGPLGWVTDKEKGYRYEPRHPATGRPWAPIPAALLALWEEVAGYPAGPQACLVNLYREGARLGLHVDWDEEATDAAVVSVSLGDDALFRLGGPSRRDPTRSMRLRSGDVVVLGGAARACHHGVDRIYPGTSRLTPGGGRINLTMRRVTKPA